MRIDAALVATLVPVAAQAKSWNCQSGGSWYDNGKIVVVAWNLDSDSPLSAGGIGVAGTTHEAFYRVDGFNRRWDFGLDAEGNYDFAFILRPDGSAAYYDFSDVEGDRSVGPDQFFVCREAEEPDDAPTE